VVDPAPSVGSGSGSGSTGSGGGPATGPGSSAGSAAGSAGSGGAALPPDAVPPVGVPPVGVPPVGVPPVGVPPVGATAVPMPVDPVPVGPRPDEAAVRKAAADVLAALGLNGADVQVASYPGFALVTAAPVVAGLPTSGYETRLQYDGSSTLTGGSGWLAPSAAGAEYPLISAQRAFDAMPKPEIARICPNTHPQNCAAPLTVITGARLGLALRHDQQFGPLLVPAWLYTLRGSALQPVAVAVDPAYLSPAPPAGYPMPAQTEPAPVRPPNPAPKPTR
jgi:hypothetical protein